MIELEIISSSGKSTRIKTSDDCVIGKSAQSEIRLDGWRIGKEHARLVNTPSGVLIEDMGSTMSGVSVNGRRIQSQYGPLQQSDSIMIGSNTLKILNSNVTENNEKIFPEDQSVDLSLEKRDQTLLHAVNSINPAHSSSIKAQHDVVKVLKPAPELTIERTRSSELESLEFEWRTIVHAKLLEGMDLRRQDVHSMSDEELRTQTDILLKRIMREMENEIPAALDKTFLCKQVLNEAIGLGPLEELLDDESVSEIMVNRYDQIYVEIRGRLKKHPLSFTSDRAVLGVIERIVAPLGRRIDESSPMVDARLKDGSRVNAIIPPLALKGPTLTIRKFSKHKLSAVDLVNFRSISPAMANFLEICVKARKNIIVSGGTGSGKTTLLNILSNFIPAGERIITIEDAAELKLHHEHLVSLEARPANVEGKGAIHIRDLVRNTLRMRPDRIVVGECRGAEALDMLQAMNTGHEGSLTTLHANTPRDGIARLETMILMAGMELPLTAIREQIASAVDIIVQQTRFSCGTRLVNSITEITGIESGRIQLQELFRFHSDGYKGEEGRISGFFTGCDMVPSFYEELTAIGSVVDLNIFKPTVRDWSDADKGNLL